MGSSSTDPLRSTPALLTSTSIVPASFWILAIAVFTEASESTSITEILIGSFSCAALSPSSGAREGLRMVAKTLWPARPSASAVARPIPVLVPVMSTEAMPTFSLEANTNRQQYTCGCHQNTAPPVLLAVNLVRCRSGSRHRYFFRVVVGNAVDQQQEGIDSRHVGQVCRGEVVGRLVIRDVHSFAVERLAILTALFRLGESADVDPVIHRNFGLVALGVRFVFVGFDVDGDIILAVRALHRCGFES